MELLIFFFVRRFDKFAEEYQYVSTLAQPFIHL